ncbi:MAG: YihY/virulence factor BrkB family protein [Betaproteobacteria bacterium]
MLLAGAVAYYTLLSLVPLLIVTVIVLAQFIEEARLMQSLLEYLDFVVPGQAAILVDQLRLVLVHREVIGGLLLLTLLFFSALAFGVLENALTVIFQHRVTQRSRHWAMSAILPYVFILFLSAGLLLVTIVSGGLGRLATHDIALLGVSHSLAGFSTYLLYLIGVAGEILLITAVYVVMPFGLVSWRHALIGGAVAIGLWEITRHILVWYYASLSQIQVVYGVFATAVTVMLSVEIGAIFLLLGAQVIANYEQVGTSGSPLPGGGLDNLRNP